MQHGNARPLDPGDVARLDGFLGCVSEGHGGRVGAAGYGGSAQALPPREARKSAGYGLIQSCFLASSPGNDGDDAGFVDTAGTLGHPHGDRPDYRPFVGLRRLPFLRARV